MPASALAGIIAFLVLLLVSTVAWFLWLLRPLRRARVARLRPVPLALCAAVVAAPWVFVTVRHVAINISIDGAWEMTAFALESVLVYAIWIVAPLTYVVVALTWLRSKQRERRRGMPTTPADPADPAP